MNTLYIIRGVQGSGKSTLGKLILGVTRAPNRCIAADDYFESRDPVNRSLVYKFDKTKLGEAHSQCRRRVEDAMGDGSGEDVVVANTFPTREQYEPYFLFACRYGYTVQIIHTEFVGTVRDDLTLSGFGDVHNCPADAIRKVQDRWEPFRL